MEAAIKTVKRLLRKTKSWTKLKTALMEWRNLPRINGSSPAQLFIGRWQHGKLPALPLHYTWIDHFTANEAQKKAQEVSKAYYDRDAKALKILEKGQDVVVQDI